MLRRCAARPEVPLGPQRVKTDPDAQPGRRYGTAMVSEFAVAAASGSLSSSLRGDAVFPHAWTADGVTVEMKFTGAHLLHLAAAGCVLNDLYREAAKAGIELNGVRVTADGDFDRDTWQSTGVTYRVEIDSDASQRDLKELIRLADAVAEIPKTLRAGVGVLRVE